MVLSIAFLIVGVLFMFFGIMISDPDPRNNSNANFFVTVGLITFLVSVVDIVYKWLG